ncbi:Gp49 family protein [Paracoccus sp. SSK6]|uniref:Gp49 family protein n=1 Tax=Paracoccus sp. SSK6 TaxID=3143131 RepID=UPI00321C17A5
MDSLKLGDDAAAAVSKTPNRVTLDSMIAKIDGEEYIQPDLMPHLTICVVKLKNGFSLVGKSAPADPENFDAELGRKFAREDAIRQMWPLEGYALRERMAEEG